MDGADRITLRRRVASIIQHIPGGALLFAVVPLVVLGYLGWFYYGAEHLDQAFYALKAEKLTVTPQPDWIKSNVTDEVFNNGRLDRVSLLDPHATATIAQAFETHNWIQSTARVSKSSSGIVMVDVVYRRPAAMVYYERTAEGTNSGKVDKFFFPIDNMGIVLPSQDFSSDDTWNYFMIIAENARPTGDTGMAYGDTRIGEALKLCSLLEEHRQQHRLQEIWVTHDGQSTGPSPWTMTVWTRDQREIVWGHTPGAENAGELTAEVKLERMLSWLKATPPAGDEIPRKLDVRFPMGNASTASHSRQ
jgi:hypothetical protein